MSKSCLIIAIFSIYLFANGQNLVPNPSFEDTLGCPQGYPDLEGVCEHWHSYRITCDYIHSCSSICGFDNQAGYQVPHSGSAYAGLVTYQVTNGNAREHLGIELISPLQVGQKYFLVFYASPGWTPLQVNIASNKLGANLLTSSYSDPDGSMALPNSATIFEENIIDDTLSWTKISGSFIAQEPYEYLAIGNFFDDVYIDTIHFPFQVVPQVAYYYIDDVCLSTDSLYCESWTNLFEYAERNQILVFPNPANDLLNINSNERIINIDIYSSIGKIVFRQVLSDKLNLSIPVSHLEAGVYFILIETERRQYFKTIIKTTVP